MVLFALPCQPVGNQILPFCQTLLLALYMLSRSSWVCMGNGFRGLIIGIVSVIIGLLIPPLLLHFITVCNSGWFDIAVAVGSTGVVGS